MATTDLHTVLSVLEATQAQDADGALGHVAPDLRQHFPSIADGVEGLREYITGSKPEDLQLTLVRSFTDAPYVFTQLHAPGPGTPQDMFAIYRLQEGRIAEHWAFAAPSGPPNQSGHTQLDGPAAPQHLDDTEANKALVRRYYEAFHLGGNHADTTQWFTGDLMIRHEPGVRDGVGQFLHDVAEIMQHRTIDTIKLLLGAGDWVFIAAEGTAEGKLCAYLDLYRVQEEKIIEHWGFPQVFPPASASRNTNRML